jgi:uncharacterized protein (TIGR02246 family)
VSNSHSNLKLNLKLKLKVESSSATMLGVVALCAAATSASAQVVPGAPRTDWERGRNEYNMEVLRAYNALMQDWREAWQRGDPKAAAEFYTDEAFLFVPDSELIQGKASIETYLTRALPGVVEIRTGLTDFVASERLAYALGPFWYEVRAAGGPPRTLTGTYVAVLVREGRRWKIRSQVFKHAT